MKDIIEAEPLAKIDYISIVDADTLEDLDLVQGKILIALAVFIGKTRLIDNVVLDHQSSCDCNGNTHSS
jgi:pantoate--beta-alanine ligase